MGLFNKIKYSFDPKGIYRDKYGRKYGAYNTVRRIRTVDSATRDFRIKKVKRYRYL